MYPVVPSEWLTGFHQHGKEQRSFVYIIAPRLYRYYVCVRAEDKVSSSTPLHGIPAGIVDSSCNIISDASNSSDSASMRPSDVVSPCLRSGPTDCSRARFGSPSATRWVRAVRYICRVRIAGCDQLIVAYY